MKKLTQEEVNVILELHEKWLAGEKDGKRANFSYCDLAGLCFAHRNLQKAKLRVADLHGANLRGADLTGADLTGANLTGANLTGADLRFADLTGVNLREADLTGADLRVADLRGADLTNANLREANLRRADLRGADLTGANLTGANLRRANLYGAILTNIVISKETIGITQVCPAKGSFIGYKKAQNKIVVLEITNDAKRSSATTEKCRCSKAKVLRIEELDGSISEETAVISSWNPNFVYKLGEIVKVDNFDTNRWNECSTGIHFFMDKEAAKQY